MSPMMQTIVATGVALLMAVAVTNAQQPTTNAPQGPPAAVEAVKEAELARFKAQMGGDWTALDALLGNELVYVHSNTQVDTKTSYVESMRSGALKYTSIVPRDMTVRVYGDTAIITAAAHITAVSNGQGIDNHLRYTDVWVKRGGRWQMVSWQSTRIP